MGSGADAEKRSATDTYRCDDGWGSESKKRPRGPGDLLLGRVHFVPSAGPSTRRGYHYTPTWRQHNQQAPSKPSGTSSFPAPNAKVANMMRLMNYEGGSGLGKHGQGILSPIKAVQRPEHHGIGTVGAEGGGPRNNGLPSTDPWTKKWKDDRGAKRSYQPSYFEGGDADGSRKQGREFCDEILAKMRQHSDATPDHLKPLVPVSKAIANSTAVIGKASYEEGTTTREELTAGDLIWVFTWLKGKYPEEYYGTIRIVDTTRVVLAPLVRPVLQRWQPLLDPTLWLGVAALLKNAMDDGSATSPYAALINDTVVPAVKASEWKATDPDRMLDFLALWEDVLPPSTTQRILEEVVMPELTAHVDSWNPRCPWQTTSCHLLLYPWVPLAGPLLEGLCATVRRKLEEGLQEWDAGRALTSNYELVSPWKTLFGPTSWELFVNGIGVVPRLKKALGELRITPPKQKDGTFGQVIIKWAPLVRGEDMVLLLEAEFFDKWLQALRHWLLSVGPPAGEAMEWCRGWKRLFTPELLADERVLARLETGFDIVRGVPQGLET